MRSYEQFARFIDKGRSRMYPGRRLCHETRVYYYQLPSGQLSIRVQYYRTSIIEFFVDGRIFINVNGFTTRTTLERLNAYTPYTFYNFRPNRRKGPAYFAIDMHGGWRWFRPEPQHRRGCYLIATPDQDRTHVYTWPDKRIQPRYGEDLKSDKLCTIDWWLREIQRRKDAQARKVARERILWNEARDNLLRAQQRMTIKTPAGNVDTSRWHDFLRRYCHLYYTLDTRFQSLETTLQAYADQRRVLQSDYDRVSARFHELEAKLAALQLQIPLGEPEISERQRVVSLQA